MIHVYVWLSRERSWGHCSMYVERADAARSRYVSWWPLDYRDVNLFEANAADPKTYSEDVALERRSPDRCFMLNIGADHLAEVPMIDAWDRWKATRVYYTLSGNCCTTVANLVRGPGGGARHSDWEPLTWWGPNDIVDYMGWLNRRFVVAEPLVPRVPPDIN